MTYADQARQLALPLPASDFGWILDGETLQAHPAPAPTFLAEGEAATVHDTEAQVLATVAWWLEVQASEAA